MIGIAGATNGFRLLFAVQPFEAYQAAIVWLRADPVEGNWYRDEETAVKGWLCPAPSMQSN